MGDVAARLLRRSRAIADMFLGASGGHTDRARRQPVASIGVTAVARHVVGYTRSAITHPRHAAMALLSGGGTAAAGIAGETPTRQSRLSLRRLRMLQATKARTLDTRTAATKGVACVPPAPLNAADTGTATEATGAEVDALTSRLGDAMRGSTRRSTQVAAGLVAAATATVCGSAGGNGLAHMVKLALSTTAVVAQAVALAASQHTTGQRTQRSQACRRPPLPESKQQHGVDSVVPGDGGTATPAQSRAVRTVRGGATDGVKDATASGRAASGDESRGWAAVAAFDRYLRRGPLRGGHDDGVGDDTAAQPWVHEYGGDIGSGGSSPTCTSAVAPPLCCRAQVLGGRVVDAIAPTAVPPPVTQAPAATLGGLVATGGLDCGGCGARHDGEACCTDGTRHLAAMYHGGYDARVATGTFGVGQPPKWPYMPMGLVAVRGVVLVWRPPVASSNRSTTTPSRTRGAFPFTPPRSVSVVPPHLVAGAVLHELCCWRHRIGIPLPARMFGLAVPGGKMFLQATAVSAQPHAQAHRSAVARLLAACDFEFSAKRRYRGGRSGMHRLHVVTAPSLLASLATTAAKYMPRAGIAAHRVSGGAGGGAGGAGGAATAVSCVRGAVRATPRLAPAGFHIASVATRVMAGSYAGILHGAATYDCYAMALNRRMKRQFRRGLVVSPRDPTPAPRVASHRGRTPPKSSGCASPADTRRAHRAKALRVACVASTPQEPVVTCSPQAVSPTRKPRPVVDVRQVLRAVATAAPDASTRVVLLEGLLKDKLRSGYDAAFCAWQWGPLACRCVGVHICLACRVQAP